MKIEPTNIEEIKTLLRDYPPEKVGHDTYQRIILAWATERARGNFYLHEMCNSGDRSHPNFGRSASDWLSEVLDEIGWPKEEVAAE